MYYFARGLEWMGVFEDATNRFFTRLQKKEALQHNIDFNNNILDILLGNGGVVSDLDTHKICEWCNAFPLLMASFFKNGDIVIDRREELLSLILPHADIYPEIQQGLLDLCDDLYKLERSIEPAYRTRGVDQIHAVLKAHYGEKLR